MTLEVVVVQVDKASQNEIIEVIGRKLKKLPGENHAYVTTTNFVWALQCQRRTVPHTSA